MTGVQNPMLCTLWALQLLLMALHTPILIFGSLTAAFHTVSALPVAMASEANMHETHQKRCTGVPHTFRLRCKQYMLTLSSMRCMFSTLHEIICIAAKCLAPARAMSHLAQIVLCCTCRHTLRSH